MKKLVVVLAVLTMSVLGGLFWLSGNIDHLVRQAMVTYGSEMTQAKVTVGGVSISALNGNGRISDLSIGNPHGFRTPHAFKVKELRVAIDPGSLAREVVRIHRIAIIAPDIIYEKGERLTNFDALQKNIAAHLGSGGKSSAGAAQTGKPAKKMIVGEFVIQGAKAHAAASFLGGAMIDVTLPDLRLHDLGKAQGGMTSAELGQEIAGALKKQLSLAIRFDQLGHLGKGAGEAGGQVMRKVGKLF